MVAEAPTLSRFDDPGDVDTFLAFDGTKIVPRVPTVGVVANGSVTTAKLADVAVTTPKLADGAVTVGKLGFSGSPSGTTFARGDGTWGNAPAPADASVTTQMLAPTAVTQAKMAAAAVGIAQLNITGTPDSTKFLRGDGTWSAPPAGAGGGDMTAANNLSDLTNKPLAITNLGAATAAHSHALGGVLTGTPAAAAFAALAVDNAALAANAVTTAKITNAAVTLAKLSATGTPSTATFLRGDYSWTPTSISYTGTAPTSPITGQLWYDTTNTVLKMWNGAWLVLGTRLVCTSGTRPSNPFDGLQIFETDTRRDYIYSSASGLWVVIRPLGWVAQLDLTASSANFSSTTYFMPLAFTQLPNRRYRLRFCGSVYSAPGAQNISIGIANNAGAILNQNYLYAHAAGASMPIVAEHFYTTGPADTGSITFKISAYTNGGNAQINGAATGKSTFLIEDLGPA